MDSLKNILQQCREKQNRTSRQRKTVVSPAFRKEFFHLTVHCANGYSVLVDDLKQASIACMPLARAPNKIDMPRGFEECAYHYTYKTIRQWGIFQWHASWGIRIYTGVPSERDGALWHDLEFTYQAINTAPEAVSDCLEALISLTKNPLLTMTPSGGLRFSCRITDYLHRKSEQIHIYKHTPTPENADHRDIYLAISGEDSYTQWDTRHEILIGNLIEPPTLEKDVLFAPLDKLKAELHQPASYPIREEFEPPVPKYKEPDPEHEAKIIAVRAGKLAPLAIKRPRPILHKQIRNAHTHDFTKRFQQCEISASMIENWCARGKNDVLGAFAKTLLKVLAIRSRSHGYAVQRIRNAVYTFEWRESEIVAQMQSDSKYWHKLKKFFAHYKRDTDAPMRWDDNVLEFWLPNGKMDTPHLEPRIWHPGNQIFQIRTGYHGYQSLFDYNAGKYFVMTQAAKTFLDAIETEVARDTRIKHAMVTPLKSFKGEIDWDTPVKDADVLWIVGIPECGLRSLWLQAQCLFGADETPISYERDGSGYFEDKRLQTLYEHTVATAITEYIQKFQIHLPNKKVVLLTALPVPGITDRSETLLFDWVDYEIAGNLDNLAETLRIRRCFEADRDDLTATSNKKEVQRILGCSSRHANRVLMELRGGELLRVPMREQILEALADGEKKTAELAEQIEGHPKAVINELTRLVKRGEILRVRWGVYVLNKEQFSIKQDV